MLKAVTKLKKRLKNLPFKSAKSKKTILAVGLSALILVPAIIIAFSLMTDDKPRDLTQEAASVQPAGVKPVNLSTVQPPKKYTVSKVNLTCKKVSARPDAPPTIDYCSGDIKLRDESNKETTYKVSDLTHVSNKGAEQKLNTLPTLEGKTLTLTLKVGGVENDTLTDILYYQ
jgi:hypothetical protein